MLNYIILFCIISFCYKAETSIQGRYDQLVFAQRSPVVSYFAQHNNWPSVSSSSKNILRMDWIIHGLRPVSLHGTSPTNCTPPYTSQMQYDHSSLLEDFKEELRTKWPVLGPNQSEESLWGSEYQRYGSCITSQVIFYFYEALRTLDSLNIGYILAKSSIIPGQSYELNHIIAAIVTELEYDVNIICVYDEESGKQYLLEVQICLSPGREIANCYFSGTPGCDIEHSVLYPFM